MELTLDQVCNHINTITDDAMDALFIPHDERQHPTFKYVQATEYTRLPDKPDKYMVCGSILHQTAETGILMDTINAVRAVHGDDESFDPAKVQVLAVSSNVVNNYDRYDKCRLAVDVLKAGGIAPKTLTDWLSMFFMLGAQHYGCELEELKRTETYAMFHLASGNTAVIKFNPAWGRGCMVNQLANVFPNAVPALIQFIDESLYMRPMNWTNGDNTALLHLVEGEAGLRAMLSEANGSCWSMSVENLLWKNYAGKRGARLFTKLAESIDGCINYDGDEGRLNLVGYKTLIDKDGGIQGLTEIRRMSFGEVSVYDMDCAIHDWIRRRMSEEWEDATLVGFFVDQAEKIVTMCFGQATIYHPANPDAWQAMLQMVLSNTIPGESDSAPVIVIKKHKSLRKYHKIKDNIEATFDEAMEKIRSRSIVPVHFQAEMGDAKVILHVVDFA